jgi:hypothetical protein
MKPDSTQLALLRTHVSMALVAMEDGGIFVPSEAHDAAKHADLSDFVGIPAADIAMFLTTSATKIGAPLL